MSSATVTAASRADSAYGRDRSPRRVLSFYGKAYGCRGARLNRSIRWIRRYGPFGDERTSNLDNVSPKRDRSPLTCPSNATARLARSMPRRRSAAQLFAGEARPAKPPPGTASEAPSEAATSVVGNGSPLETWPRMAPSAPGTKARGHPSWSAVTGANTFPWRRAWTCLRARRVAAVNYPRRDNHQAGGLGVERNGPAGPMLY